MFQIEEVNNSHAKCFKENGGQGLITVLPLDNIPVDIPKSWTFKPTCMPVEYKSKAEAFANFEAREDDIWIVTYPKCGTTWTQELAWMLVNDLNFEKANSVDITTRSIFFELEALYPTDIWENLEILNNQVSPRVIKTHLPIGLLPRDIWRKKCKIIYTSRDPKDAVVSYYHHKRHGTTYKGSLEEFTEQFITDNMTFCSYWNHILEFHLIQDQSNILFLSFEDMKKDLRTVIERSSKFLKKQYTTEQISQLMDHLSFDKMKDSPTCNNQSLVKFLHAVQKADYDENTAFKFMRKGQVGDHKKELSRSCIERINAKTREMFQPHGLNLYCE